VNVVEGVGDLGEPDVIVDALLRHRPDRGAARDAARMIDLNERERSSGGRS